MKVHCPGCSQEGVGETLGTLAGKALPRENFIAQSRQGLQCPAVQMEVARAGQWGDLAREKWGSDC